MSGNSVLYLPARKRCFESSLGGIFPIFKAGWFQDVIRADFWMCGLVVFRALADD